MGNKNLSWLMTGVKNRLTILRGYILTIYLRMLGCKVGKRLRCKSWPIFRTIPDGNIEIGDYVNVGYRITFECRGKGKIVIGNHVNLTQEVLISSASKITFCDWSGVAERVSIRDSDHIFKIGKHDRELRLLSLPIQIGENVSIGAFSIILMGANIPEGAVLGAMSTVRRSDKLEPNGIYHGNPLKHVGFRAK